MKHKIVTSELQKTNIEIIDLCERVNKEENLQVPYAISQVNIPEPFNWKPIELLLLSDNDGEIGDLVYDMNKKIRTVKDETVTESFKIIASYPKLENFYEFKFWFVENWTKNPVDNVDVKYETNDDQMEIKLFIENNLVSCE